MLLTHIVVHVDYNFFPEQSILINRKVANLMSTCIHLTNVSIITVIMNDTNDSYIVCVYKQYDNLHSAIL